MMCKKIGFVDFYLSEWHAIHYPEWLKAARERIGLTDYTVAYAWAEQELSPVDGKSSTQWRDERVAETGEPIELCDTLEELCEKSDVILVLAPSDPEKHLLYAKTVLKYGKPTYIDKTFAPNLAEAEEIYRIGEENGTPFFSTSALRYAKELDQLIGADCVITTGGGYTAEEYLVHQLEMTVKLLGVGATAVKSECGNERDRFYAVSYDDERSARLTFAPSYEFTVTARDEHNEWRTVSAVTGTFPTLMEKILYFYETKEIDFGKAQTLEVMRLREALLNAQDTPGQWVEI